MTLSLNLPFRLRAYGTFGRDRQGPMNEWHNTATSNRSTDQDVKLLVPSDGKLKMTRCDTLHSQIL